MTIEERKALIKDLVRAARGEELLDLVIEGGKVVSVFTGELLDRDIGIKDGMIATLEPGDLPSKERVSVKGAFVAPSFIDGHIHVESSMLSPERFAEAVVPKGTGAVVSDPHEIANVLGVRGVVYMRNASSGLPMDFHFTIPSCVPATHLETAGASISSKEVRELMDTLPGSPALSEMMNFPGVLSCDGEVISKIASARERGMIVDGHSPMLTGRDLDAYLSAGIGTDHESTTEDEVLEKLRKGCFILAREGSASKNLEAAIKSLTPASLSRAAIVSDDRHPESLLEEGHLDSPLRKAVSLGLSPVDAIRLVTINPALAFNLDRVGAVAPGYFASLVVLDNLRSFRARYVYHRGRLVAENGRLVSPFGILRDDNILSTVTVPEGIADKLIYPVDGLVNSIRVFPDQILTRKEVAPVSDAGDGGLNYAAVIERHGRNGNVGIGFVSGFGLKEGAIASTVSHDSHNIVSVGANTSDMAFAAEALAGMGGGYVIVKKGEVLASLPLEVAGLMSLKPAREVASSLKLLHENARSLGTTLPSPLMTMSFIALPVIPEIRLTDKGLVDVVRFDFIPLKAD